jgi:Multiubiquitin
MSLDKGNDASAGKEPDKGGSGEHGGKNDTVDVSVNEQAIKLPRGSATGAEIKAAAIAQGVHIQSNFVLQEELPNGTSRIVGDNDNVKLREHLRFTAIAPDDNS